MFDSMKLRMLATHELPHVPRFLLRPLNLVATYDRANLRMDLVAGLTVAVIALPQALAIALVAELPPSMGLYTAIVGAAVASLWGSSNQGHTGPTNAIALLVLSSLATGFRPGSPEFILAAGLMAIMVGIFQLGLGMARLGMLVNFVSHSVIIGFTAGAGVLIATAQLKPFLGLSFSSHTLFESLSGVGIRLGDAFLPAAGVGLAAIILMLFLPKINRRIPAALLAMVVASAVVAITGLDKEGLDVIGSLPKGLPPFIDLDLFTFDFVRQISSGALAVGAIGLVEVMAISQSIASQTGQRLDSNQEFVGQGLANVASGLLSGFPCSGSFARSAVNLNAGARSPIAATFSSAFVLIGMLLLAPFTRFLPRAALAGVLIVIASRMINRQEIIRIWRGARPDAMIMLVTFLGTLFLEIAFAVLLGIILSFGLYILRTSVPRVHQVQPDEDYRHLTYRPSEAPCPQLGIIDILGDLYFGAVNHVEEVIHSYAERHHHQRFLLITMHNVNHCDFSGIHMLENVVRSYRDRGGDVFLVKVGYQVNKLMESTGFHHTLGPMNILSDDGAISYLFHHVLDPAVCIYECPYRVFQECQNLPKRLYSDIGSEIDDAYAVHPTPEIEAKTLWKMLRNDSRDVTLIDVREPREYRLGHIPGAQLVPLPEILSGNYSFALSGNQKLVFVCRSGRRSKRAADRVAREGLSAEIVQGGMLAWEAADLLEAVE